MRSHVTIALAAALTLATGISACGPSGEKNGKTEASKQEPQALKLPEGTPMRPQGMKALAMRATAEETFSAAAIEAYLQADNLPMNGGDASSIRVESVRFLSNAEVQSELDGEQTGLGPDAKLAFATLSGDFVFTGPPGGKPARFTRAFAVFDMDNGNLMLTGALADINPTTPEQPQ